MPSSKPSATRRPPSSGSRVGAPTVRPARRGAPAQQHPPQGLLGRRSDRDPRRAAASPATAATRPSSSWPPTAKASRLKTWRRWRDRRLRLRRFHDHFGFFLPLAGITTVKQIRENAFDIKATGRLNRLYVELLKENPDWDTAARRQDLNHFFARLIFCFFAERHPHL